MHLPVAVHRHPRAGDDPDRQELPGLSPTRATLVASNLTRSTILASELEVGGSLWAKFKGLMGRSTLDAGAGLWLPDSNGIHMMFMRFPIDAVFLGKPLAAGEAGAAEDGGANATTSGTAHASGDPGAVGEVRPVVSVHAGLRAWTGLVPFIRGAHGVLELPVGAIELSGTVPGDVIRLE